MDRKVWVFALVGVAPSIAVTDGKVTEALIVLGGVAPIPWRVPAAEQALSSSAPSSETFVDAADAALADARPLVHNGYKVWMENALVQQALSDITSGEDRPQNV